MEFNISYFLPPDKVKNIDTTMLDGKLVISSLLCTETAAGKVNNNNNNKQAAGTRNSLNNNKSTSLSHLEEQMVEDDMYDI